MQMARRDSRLALFSRNCATGREQVLLVLQMDQFAPQILGEVKEASLRRRLNLIPSFIWVTQKPVGFNSLTRDFAGISARVRCRETRQERVARPIGLVVS
jgi:hypothetical protein